MELVEVSSLTSFGVYSLWYDGMCADLSPRFMYQHLNTTTTPTLKSTTAFVLWQKESLHILCHYFHINIPFTKDLWLWWDKSFLQPCLSCVVTTDVHLFYYSVIECHQDCGWAQENKAEKSKCQFLKLSNPLLSMISSVCHWFLLSSFPSKTRLVFLRFGFML